MQRDWHRYITLPELRGVSRNIRAGMWRAIRREMNWALLVLFAIGVLVPVCGMERHVPRSYRMMVMIAGYGFAFVLYVEYGRRMWRQLVRDKWPSGRPPICYACGYDLRGSPGEVCPECGERIPHARDVLGD